MKALLTYFKESWQELQKVTWPTRQQALRLTVAVVILSGIVGLYISAADYALVRLLEQVILGV